MKSRLYTGSIQHARLTPVTHRFSYPIYLYALDLDELPRLDAELPLFGYNRPRVASIYDRDYLDKGSTPIREKVLRQLRVHGIDEPVGRIVLVTGAAYFRHIFNPVSFYYCFTPSGSIATLMAEVNNTCGDRHIYVFPPDGRETTRGFIARHRIQKTFYVSPFNRVTGEYDCRFADIDQRLDIHIDLFKEGRPAMTASVTAEGVPLSAETHGKVIRSHPLTPWLAMPRILAQAGKLYFKKKLRMVSRPFPRSADTLVERPLKRSERLCMRAVEKKLENVKTGRLDVHVPGFGLRRFGVSDARPGAEMTIHSPAFFKRVVVGGDVGFGEAYMRGEWDSSDATALLAMFVENREHLAGRVAPRPVAALTSRLRAWRRRNTRAGSRRNIGDHYDLGNDFFVRWLDESMTYSSGIYTPRDRSLASAQERKLDRIVSKADLGPEEHVLEIGCGWGSFAIRAAKTRGCRVTGLTLSRAQFEWASRRVREERLEDRVTIRLADYRDIRDRYDRIVSIEMLEAVGHKGIFTFFDRCARLLTEPGRVVVQVITIPDEQYERYRRREDWIRKYIFPGGMLPCVEVLKRAATTAGFVVKDQEDIGPHYAATLAEWRRRFLADPELSTAFRNGSEFHRQWIYYFCYCEAGFATGYLGDRQMTFTVSGSASKRPL